jgi:hypothetical protein
MAPVAVMNSEGGMKAQVGSSLGCGTGTRSVLSEWRCELMAFGEPDEYSHLCHRMEGFQ